MFLSVHGPIVDVHVISHVVKCSSVSIQWDPLVRTILSHVVLRDSSNLLTVLNLHFFDNILNSGTKLPVSNVIRIILTLSEIDEETGSISPEHRRWMHTTGTVTEGLRYSSLETVNEELQDLVVDPFVWSKQSKMPGSTEGRITLKNSHTTVKACHHLCGKSSTLPSFGETRT